MISNLFKRVTVSCLTLLTVCSLCACGSKADLVNEGMEMIQQLDYQGALTKLEEAETEGENIRLIARGRGIAYMGMMEYEKAIECFLEALSLSDGIVQDVDFDINYYLAAAYTKTGQYVLARQTYDAIIQLRPTEDAFFLRGSVALAMGDYTGAKADFDTAVEKDPKNYDRLLRIYEALAQAGYREAGQEYLDDVLNAKDASLSSFDMGRIYYYMGEYQNACLEFEKAREDGNEESCLYLGKSYEALGDYNYASNVYNSYLAKNEGSAKLYNQLGLCEMAKKDYQKALSAFQSGLQQEDKEMRQTLSFNEIVAYEYLGDFDTALGLLNTYLDVYPDDETAKREKEFLSTR